MAKTQTAAQTAPAVDDAALAEMRRLIFDAPIAELAESQGISIDEAVKLRVEKNLEEASMPVSVTVRPIEPQGITPIRAVCCSMRILPIPARETGFKEKNRQGDLKRCC